MNILKLLSLAGIIIVSASCTSSIEHEESQSIKKISASINDFKEESPIDNTRTSINISSEDAISYRFAEGDIIGVYPTNGNQISFTLTENTISENGKNAYFDGGDWALKSNRTYYAYLPFQASAYSSFTPNTDIPVSYLGQISESFGSTENASQYDFLGAGATISDDSGILNFSFKRVGALLRIKITLPATCKYQSLTLSTDNEVIPVSGHIDLTSSAIAFTPEKYASSLAIDLNNAEGTEGETAYVYVMLSPMDLKTQQKSLSLRLSYNNGSISDYSLYRNGVENTPDFAADYIYKRDAVLVETPKDMSTEGFGSKTYEW